MSWNPSKMHLKIVPFMEMWCKISPKITSGIRLKSKYCQKLSENVKKSFSKIVPFIGMWFRMVKTCQKMSKLVKKIHFENVASIENPLFRIQPKKPKIQWFLVHSSTNSTPRRFSVEQVEWKVSRILGGVQMVTKSSKIQKIFNFHPNQFLTKIFFNFSIWSF